MNHLLTFLLIINLITFLIFGYDKKLAAKNKGRISEKSLLILSLLGGTIGAFLAIQLFRHKTKKKSFLMKMIGVAIVQILVIIGLLFSGNPQAQP